MPLIEDDYIVPVEPDDYPVVYPENIVKNQKTFKLISEIPSRDFDEEEVKVLNSFPGWHAGIEGTQVLKLLKPLIRESGCYIIWFWRNIKRPAICVTHENELKTLIIHKRPDSVDSKRAAFYFINKDERKCNTLKEIVEYHMKHGVYDLTKKPNRVQIFFNKPV